MNEMPRPLWFFIAIAAAILANCQPAFARKWLAADGKLVEGELILIRESSIVVRLEGRGIKLLEIPYAELRDLDRRYLKDRRNYEGPSPKARREGMSSLAFQLLDECPSFGDIDSPVDLVRAVNHLHGLGKDRALAVLDESIEADDRSLATDTTCVFKIVPLLFETPDNDDEGVWRGLRSEGMFFVTLTSDLPFDNLYQAHSILTSPQMKRDLTRMARDRGVFRNCPMRPGDPFAAAEEAGRIDAAKRKDDGGLGYMRVQAYSCIDHLLPLEWECAFAGGLNDARWEKLKELALLMRICWSEEKQEYVAANKGPLPPPPEAFFPSRTRRR